MRLARRFDWRATLPWIAVVGLVAIAVLLIQWLVVRPYEIPSDSMEPTLEAGQGILVNRLVYRLRDPEVGDVVVFRPPAAAVGGRGRCWRTPGRGEACATPSPQAAGGAFVKRIAAGPGDRIRIEGGHAIVNGERRDPAFVGGCRGRRCELPVEVTVPADHYYVLGDNRAASEDSRVWGPVHADWIIGEAFFVYSPLDSFGRL